MNDDLISRQAAIDALGEAPKYKQKIIKTYAEGRNDQWFDDVARLSAVPSAQPEIVRCKDCVHYDPAKNGYNGHCTRQYAVFTTAYDFCSYGLRRGDEE